MSCAIPMKLDIVSAFDRIYKRVSGGQVPIAVFIVSGKARETPINSSLFKEVSVTMPEKLLGIYDNTVDPAWLKHDLQSAESEVRHEHSSGA